MKHAVLMLFVGMAGLIGAEKIETLRLAPCENMTRAELHYVKTVPSPKAVLVLCPGCNGSGEDLIRSPKWMEFAKQHQLGLVGLSFASPTSSLEDDSGYYYASRGSGEKLLEGIHKIYGRDLPLLLYGFSGGAHFTSRFEQWKPERVKTWCAYSAGWWDEPKKETSSPGLVACGDEDPRYGASLIYFKQGRAAGKRWLWVSLAKTGHADNPALNDFVRNYFSQKLSTSKATPSWVDIDRNEKVSDADQAAQPSLTGWMPSEELFEQWRKINTP